MNSSKLTRVEVIDHRAHSLTPGRVYVEWDEDMEVELSVQDDERTLKIFLRDRV